ncbi:MAG: AMP-binding protein, partial [Bacteroidaceae bacterium]
TVIATYSVLDGESEVTIGKPLPLYEVYLVNEDLSPVKSGQEGEIVIGGESVARGYLNKDELTATKFVETDRVNGMWTRFYRSGDRGRENEKGEIVFLGRSDAQIKVRGFRVELTEIEMLLLNGSGIQAAAVTLDMASQQLAAFVVEKNGEKMDRKEIAQLLRSKLPYYMIPSTLDVMDALPMTTSQKVDRNRLPSPVTPLSKVSEPRLLVEPQTELEKKLVASLAIHFEREDISLTDHFFDDLGGHSLLAAVIVSELREQDLFANLSVMDIYEHPVLTDLVACLAQKTTKENHYQKRKVNESSRLSYLLCSLAQGISLIFIALLFGTEWLGPFFVYSYYYQADCGALYSLAMMLLMYFSLLPVLSILTIGLKWLIIGRIRAGDYKLWGT